jgi:hypothetical protein
MTLEYVSVARIFKMFSPLDAEMTDSPHFWKRLPRGVRTWGALDRLRGTGAAAHA